MGVFALQDVYVIAGIIVQTLLTLLMCVGWC